MKSLLKTIEASFKFQNWLKLAFALEMN